jgi:hypothetical protein
MLGKLQGVCCSARINKYRQTRQRALLLPWITAAQQPTHQKSFASFDCRDFIAKLLSSNFVSGVFYEVKQEILVSVCLIATDVMIMATCRNVMKVGVGHFCLT